MDSFDFIKVKQSAWARRKGYKPVARAIPDSGEKNFLPDLTDNLYKPSGKAISYNQLKYGNYRNDTEVRLADLKCLHSSAALAFNLFQYWLGKDIRQLLIALRQIRKDNKAYHDIETIEYEKRFEISDDKTKFRVAQNIDVFISISSIGLLAVESRLAEPYYSGTPEGLSQDYVNEASFWKNLPHLRELTKQISPKNRIFQHFNAAQTIKHILGLQKACRKRPFCLLYLWYEVPGESGINHRKEIEKFAKIAKKDKVKFRHATYQEIIMKLMKECYEENKDYLDYLTDRYL